MALTDDIALAEALQRRSLAIFIGADLPQATTGLPSRADLARGLAQRHGLDETLSLAEVAQRVGQAGNRFDFTNYIRNALETTGKAPQAFHRRLVEVVQQHEVETLITTAYDNLLELAFQQAGTSVNRVVRGGDVSFINRDRPTLIKLYGDAQQPDTLVVTDRDHSQLLRDREREPVVDEVRQAFRRNTVLFLGYSLSDPDFHFLLDQVAESRFARLAYAVWPDLPEVDVRMWRDRGVVILDADPLQLVGRAGAPMASISLPEATPPVSEAAAGPPSPQAPQTAAQRLHLQTQLEELQTRHQRLSKRIQALDQDIDQALSQEQKYIFLERKAELEGEREEIARRMAKTEEALKGGQSTDALLEPEEKREGEREAPQPADPSPQPSWVTFKLQLARQAGLQFEVRALQTPMGEPQAVAQLPFDEAGLLAVLQVLEAGDYQAGNFSVAQREALQGLDLVRDGRLVPKHLRAIGQALHRALLPGDVGVAFRLAFNQARQNRNILFLQLRFDHDAVDLARYPWELLHDGQRHLVSAGAVEMTRYITYGEAPPSLPVTTPARLLYVEARPKDLVALPPDSERLAVWQALQPLASSGQLILDQLETPTYDALLDRLAGADYHLIHFDGHGLLAGRCPKCQALNPSHAEACQNCQTSLQGVSSQGYLAFEDSSGKADLVSTEEMENLLLNSQVRLMFLSACQSGEVGGGSLFGGVASGLIRAGVPAVVAMQFSVPASSTTNFATSFYTALARNQTISRAVAQGRRRLFREHTWFIPTLHLRSQDDEGHVLAS